MSKLLPLCVLLFMTLAQGCSSLPQEKSQPAANHMGSGSAASGGGIQSRDFSGPAPNRNPGSNPAGDTRNDAVGEKPPGGLESASPVPSATFPEKTVAGSAPKAESGPTLRSITDWNFNISYFQLLYEDTKDVLLSPLDWDGKDWLHAMIVAAVTGALAPADREIKEWVQENRSEGTNRLSDVVEPLGDGRFTLGALGTFYLLGEALDKEPWRRTALLTLESAFITALFTQGLKFAIGRDRPGPANSQGRLNGFEFSSGKHSFPSGHTSHAFAVATVFANEYKQHKWVPPAAYGLATLTGLSRINDNRHWASDVFFGAALGYYTSKTLIKIYDQAERKVFILPQFDGEMAGFKVRWELP